jgi:hypothetical protein
MSFHKWTLNQPALRRLEQELDDEKLQLNRVGRKKTVKNNAGARRPGVKSLILKRIRHSTGRLTVKKYHL